jgi:hypothetical protein
MTKRYSISEIERDKIVRLADQSSLERVRSAGESSPQNDGICVEFVRVDTEPDAGYYIGHVELYWPKDDYFEVLLRLVLIKPFSGVLEVGELYPGYKTGFRPSLANPEHSIDVYGCFPKPTTGEAITVITDVSPSSIIERADWTGVKGLGTDGSAYLDAFGACANLNLHYPRKLLINIYIGFTITRTGGDRSVGAEGPAVDWVKCILIVNGVPQYPLIEFYDEYFWTYAGGGGVSPRTRTLTMPVVLSLVAGMHEIKLEVIFAPLSDPRHDRVQYDLVIPYTGWTIIADTVIGMRYRNISGTPLTSESVYCQYQNNLCLPDGLVPCEDDTSSSGSGIDLDCYCLGTGPYWFTMNEVDVCLNYQGSCQWLSVAYDVGTGELVYFRLSFDMISTWYLRGFDPENALVVEYNLAKVSWVCDTDNTVNRVLDTTMGLFPSTLLLNYSACPDDTDCTTCEVSFYITYPALENGTCETCSDYNEPVCLLLVSTCTWTANSTPSSCGTWVYDLTATGATATLIIRDVGNTTSVTYSGDFHCSGMTLTYQNTTGAGLGCTFPGTIQLSPSDCVSTPPCSPHTTFHFDGSANTPLGNLGCGDCSSYWGVVCFRWYYSPTGMYYDYEWRGTSIPSPPTSCSPEPLTWILGYNVAGDFWEIVGITTSGGLVTYFSYSVDGKAGVACTGDSTLYLGEENPDFCDMPESIHITANGC